MLLGWQIPHQEISVATTLLHKIIVFILLLGLQIPHTIQFSIGSYCKICGSDRVVHGQYVTYEDSVSTIWLHCHVPLFQFRTLFRPYMSTHACMLWDIDRVGAAYLRAQHPCGRGTRAAARTIPLFLICPCVLNFGSANPTTE